MANVHPQNQPPHEDNPLTAMLISLSGSGGPAHETGPPGANELSVRAGHEPDRFQVRSILYVPAAVVVVLVLAYLLVTWLFTVTTSGRDADLVRRSSRTRWRPRRTRRTGTSGSPSTARLTRGRCPATSRPVPPNRAARASTKRSTRPTAAPIRSSTARSCPIRRGTTPSTSGRRTYGRRTTSATCSIRSAVRSF